MNRTFSPEASTWSSVASIRRRALQQRAIISQVGAIAFGRCCIAGFTDVPLRAHEERRLLDYGCGITAVVGRPTWRVDEVSLEEFKAARAEFKAKIRHYALRSIAFLGKRALSAMIGTASSRLGSASQGIRRDDGPDSAQSERPQQGLYARWSRRSLHRISDNTLRRRPGTHALRVCLKSPGRQSSIARDRFRKPTRAVQLWRQQPLNLPPWRTSGAAGDWLGSLESNFFKAR
jgi:hypothetical protein